MFTGLDSQFFGWFYECQVASHLISFMLNLQVRSCSTGKQRRSRLPSKFTDKDFVTKGPLLADERSLGTIKPRSPSPPIRRSISTDRAAVIRHRIKSDAPDNPPVIKVPFPASLSVNKSVANVPPIIPSAMNIRPMSSQEPSLPNALIGLQRVTLRRVQPENEEEQFKQALNIRQGGIRKTKQESKVKTKQHASTKVHKSMAAEALLSDVAAGKMQETEKADVSDPENENGPFGSTTCGTTRLKKLHRNFLRNSQNVEPRYVTKFASEV